MANCIAERRLLYSDSGSTDRKELIVRLYEPKEVLAGAVEFDVDPGTYACELEIVGIEPEFRELTYGADSLQAVALASDIDPILKRLTKYFDFFFPNGEPYFE